MVASLREDHEKVIHEVEKYRLLIESVHGYAIFLLDASGYIETWNIGAQEINGHAANEIIGKHFSVLYTPKDIAAGKPDKELLHAAQHGRIEDEDWRVRKDGTHFWADTTITALHNHRGALVGFAKVTRDSTERKNAEEALVRANNRFKQQHIKLEALNNIKDEFISLASHQLRTPATGIKQFLGMMLEGYAGDMTDTQLHYLQKAYDNNERQINLVNSLLRTAQIDAGKTILNKSMVTLRSLIEDVVGDLKEVLDNRQQTIIIKEPTALPAASIDEPRMRMVIENLIDNASKYTDVGGQITIRLSQTKTHMVIVIKDTGVGIAKQDIKRVYDKFNRIPNKLSDEAGGSGLGLYWAKKIIALHKGSIHVTSKLDVGTEFKVKIPKDTVDA